MRSLRWITTAVTVSLAAALASDSLLSHTATVHVWPLAAPSPTPYLEIAYDPSSLQASATKIHHLQLSTKDGVNALVRVGLWDRKSKEWRGVVTAASAFDNSYTPTLSLNLDAAGHVWHVGFQASRPRKNDGIADSNKEGVGEQVRVKVVTATAGPKPVLNEPLVLDEHGKMAEKEVEKSFLQR